MIFLVLLTCVKCVAISMDIKPCLSIHLNDPGELDLSASKCFTEFKNIMEKHCINMCIQSIPVLFLIVVLFICKLIVAIFVKKKK